MIIFDKVIYKNFLSTGNDPIVFDLKNSKSNIIIGKNGNGKSSVLDAICYGLFGKPHRDINKNQLINSVNQKNCLVEIYFNIGSINYKIVRGMKPNIFEIYQDNNLMNKTSDIRDYQKILEQQILKLNYKTFTQVVILGSASFTPFMQLSSHGRREVIEDILDIGIFSLMNQLNKEKSTQTKDELNEVENKIKVAISKIESQKKIISNLMDNHNGIIESITNRKNKLKIELDSANNKLDILTSEISELINSLPDDNNKLIKECNTKIYKNIADKESLEQKIKFINSNSECPSCEQNIPHSHKDGIILASNEKIEYINSNLNELQSHLDNLINVSNEHSRITKLIQEKNLLISSTKTSISNITKMINECDEELKNTKNNTGNIDSEKQLTKDLANAGKQLVNRKNILMSQKNIENISGLLLKDNGIKTSIIREYLPVMNMTINKYLDMMDFFVKFELDENFNESIKSRYRDDFSYASFSEGEKQKIDVSLLLAWRNIAKLKNSVNTNILFLDEVLSTHIDANSVELLLSILDEMKKETNIFAISHTSDQFLDRFDKVIKFEKVGNFSTMTIF